LPTPTGQGSWIKNQANCRIKITKVASDYECGSPTNKETWLGEFDTLQLCGDACASRSNCTYFIYGKKNSRGLCYVQTGKIAKPIFTRDKKPTFPFTHNELCPNGKVTTVYDFFYMAVREKQKNKLKKIRKHKKKHPYSKKVHYYDIYDTTYATKEEGQPHNFLNEWKLIDQISNTSYEMACATEEEVQSHNFLSDTSQPHPIKFHPIQLRPTGKLTIVRNNLKAPNGAHNFLNWTHMNFDSCAVVGSGSSLLNSGFGADIDNHDAVFRINSAPTKGFQQDVGSFTTFRVSYGITCLHALMTDDVPSNGICTAESTGKEYVLGAFNLMKKDIEIHERLYKRAWGNLLYNHTKIKSAKDLHMFYHLSGKAASYYGLEVYKATSGYNAILASLDLCNSIDLYGFDLGHSMSLNHMPKKAHYYDIYDTTYATKKEGQPHNFLNEWKRINQMTNTTEWARVKHAKLTNKENDLINMELKIKKYKKDIQEMKEAIKNV